MSSRTGRIALIVVGIVAVAVGGVWTLQGLNVLPGSFMTGSRTWLTIGLIAVAAGAVALWLALRRRPR